MTTDKLKLDALVFLKNIKTLWVKLIYYHFQLESPMKKQDLKGMFLKKEMFLY